MKKDTMLFFSNILFVCLSFSLFAQDATQSARGVVLDKDTKEPLLGVTVELFNFLPLKSAVTDASGQFAIEGVPIGKQRFLVTHDDYDVVIVPEVVVLSGKEVSMNISLEKLPEELKEIVVKANKINKSTKDVPINHMALTGIRSFTIEELKRYPTSYEDPARLVAKFAGVSRFNTETGIVVRGHNPHTVLWRMEGIPISNPNHQFFREGPTGYFPIFNIYLLDNSDFLNGAYPAEYGNAISGVLDLTMRNGNNRNFEGSVKVGVNGIEGFLEGPLAKNKKASFIVGGRYSFLHLIAPNSSFPQMADLSFKLNTKTKLGEVNVFGVGGISEINIDISEQDSVSSAARFSNDFINKKTYGLLGVNFKHFLKSKKGYISTTVANNYNHEYFNAFSDSVSFIKTYSSRTVQTTWSTLFHYVVNRKHQIRTGIVASHFFLDFLSNDSRNHRTYRDYTGHTFLIQAHAQWLFKISKKLKINIGVNGIFLGLNNSYGISPRLALSWQVSYSHRLSVGYTWSYQMQPWEAYLNQSNRGGDIGQLVDKNLGFTRNHSFSIAYDWLIMNNWRFKAEVYGQFHDAIPVNIYQPEMSFANHSLTQNMLEETHFENKGQGLTYGIELTFEKFFSNGYYGMFTATYFDTKYSSTDNVWRNKETNNNVMANLLVGKEFKIGKKKNTSLFLDLSYAFKLGNYYSPIDVDASKLAGKEIIDWERAYTIRLPAFHKVDFRIGFQFNSKKLNLSHKLIIEASNVLNQQTTYRVTLNPYTQTIVNQHYPGIRPNISYRLNFGFKKNQRIN